MSAYFTVYPYDRKGEDPTIKLDAAFVGAIPDQTAGMPAGTGNEVQIKRIYCFIVKILRNIVVVFCFNCYHKHAWI